MILSNSNTSYRSPIDRFASGGVWGLTVLATSLAGLITIFLVSEALPFLWTKGATVLFTDASWYPTENLFNLTPMLVGSLLIMIGSVAVATPLGIISAVFCQFYGHSLIATNYKKLIQLLAGIPSVVFGFWGLVELVPMIQKLHPPGVSLLAGICVVTLMILPTMTLIVDASLASLPKDYISGAMALGMSRFSTITKILIPAIRPSISTAVILSAGRAIGETMAVVMICGNIVQIPGSIFDPIRTLTANIALEMAYAVGDHRRALFVTGLILTGIVTVLILAAEMFKRDKTHE